MKKVLITGAGSGFGKLFSFELAKRGYDVIAAVESPSQMRPLREEASKNNLSINVIKIDICDSADIDYAIAQQADIVVNNAGIGEGGALIDMPQTILRKQFEVNFFATTEVAKRFADSLIKRKSTGRIVFISSIGGLMTPELAGAYCASKHALEAVAESFKSELNDFGISVSTINPGPYLTGFNDRIMEASENWSSLQENHVDHSDLTFDLPQYDENQDISAMCDVIIDSHAKFRNVFPEEFVEIIETQQRQDWEK
ncbi:SDR family oxidoreductase [Rosenbergiella epipactidis]|uniref:SDR family oxidoreductase n=1 Tax=Rosenbergiella epipactidis TaxID=1544694 RepID=UPI001F4D744D|nr:SDR family oxidoreductase [Rosenbergiella epipactidis]